MLLLQCSELGVQRRSESAIEPSFIASTRKNPLHRLHSQIGIGVVKFVDILVLVN